MNAIFAIKLSIFIACFYNTTVHSMYSITLDGDTRSGKIKLTTEYPDIKEVKLLSIETALLAHIKELIHYPDLVSITLSHKEQPSITGYFVPTISEDSIIWAQPPQKIKISLEPGNECKYTITKSDLAVTTIEEERYTTANLSMLFLSDSTPEDSPIAYYGLVTIPDEGHAEHITGIIFQLENAPSVTMQSCNRFLTIRDDSNHTWNFDLATCSEKLKGGIVIHAMVANNKGIVSTFHQRSAPRDDKDFIPQAQTAHTIFTGNREIKIMVHTDQDCAYLYFLRNGLSSCQDRLLFLNYQFSCAEESWIYYDPIVVPSSIGSVCIRKSFYQLTTQQAVHNVLLQGHRPSFYESDSAFQPLINKEHKAMRIKLVSSPKYPCKQPEKESGVTIAGMLDTDSETKTITLTLMEKIHRSETRHGVRLTAKKDNILLKTEGTMKLKVREGQISGSSHYGSLSIPKGSRFSPNQISLSQPVNYQQIIIPFIEH
ncbi:hypothetical protein CI610_00569 [invertebrate metagenome]|uniref:Uncharacterized protein n=1 Tax=invertebrate metagenome TaxID=1711999 RepID=A0A2H9TB57_9ZZZZ